MLRLLICALAAVVATATAIPSAGSVPASPPRLVEVGDSGGGGGGCKTTTVTGDAGEHVWITSTVFWCYDGVIVTSASPSMTHGSGCPLWCSSFYLEDSRCCQGRDTYVLKQRGWWTFSTDWREHIWVENDMTLRGNGTATTSWTAGS